MPLPRHVVAAFVFLREGNSILLVKQRDGRGYWSLPGGVMEQGETVEEAAIREVREETGLTVRLLRVVGLYSKPAEEAVAITFEGAIVGGIRQQVTSETTACQYWPCDSLPEPIRPHLRERVDDLQRGELAVVLRRQ